MQRETNPGVSYGIKGGFREQFLTSTFTKVWSNYTAMTTKMATSITSTTSVFVVNKTIKTSCVDSVVDDCETNQMSREEKINNIARRNTATKSTKWMLWVLTKQMSHIWNYNQQWIRAKVKLDLDIMTHKHQKWQNTNNKNMSLWQNKPSLKTHFDDVKCNDKNMTQALFRNPFWWRKLKDKNIAHVFVQTLLYGTNSKLFHVKTTKTSLLISACHVWFFYWLENCWKSCVFAALVIHVSLC